MSYKITTKTINKISQKIIQHFAPEKIILFGSHAWGNPTTDSDIDFFIIKNTNKNRIEREYELRMQLVGNKFPPIDFVIHTPQEFERRLKMNDFFIHDIIKRGRTLYAK